MPASSDPSSTALFPLFLKLGGRKVVVVGGGAVATAKVKALRGAGAAVTVVAPEISAELAALADRGEIAAVRRAFAPADLDGAWLVVAAVPPAVARAVAEAAEPARLFVLAVDDTAATSAYGAGTLTRGGVTIAVSTGGRAPALAGLLREGLEAVLPHDLQAWADVAERARATWRAQGIPIAERRPLLLEALDGIYSTSEPSKGSEPPAMSSDRRSRSALDANSSSSKSGSGS
jgi:siroheme synthase-like protein